MTTPNSVIVQAAHGASTPSPLSSCSTVELLADASRFPTWWIVEAEAREGWFDNSAGGSVVPNAQAIDQFSQRSSLIAQLTWSVETGRSLYFDLGTTLRLCVFARHVQLRVCGPSGRDGLRQAVPGRPMVRGSEVSITRVDGQAYTTDSCTDDGQTLASRMRAPTSALGLRQGQLTLRQQVLAAAPALPTIPIPVGVTDLQIFEFSAAIANAPWIFEDRSGASIGQVPLVAGVSQRVTVPGPANAIRLSAAPAANTLFSLAFGLQW
jgi:hypothetical protein